jgi:hypothetical protein
LESDAQDIFIHRQQLLKNGHGLDGENVKKNNLWIRWFKDV